MQIYLFILLIHFLADFGLQTHEQATKKGLGNSLYNGSLFQHVGVYSMVWLIALLTISTDIPNVLGITILIFFTHYLTDWITSRIGKSFWDKGDYHNGFVVVGFDQLVHYITLFYIFKLL